MAPTEIDTLNIHRASLEAMRRAVLALAPLPDAILVDAFRIPDLHIAQRGVLHGDRRCAAIAAASIVAKVSRDRQMLTEHASDPRYGYDKHKGRPSNTGPPSNGSDTRPCIAVPSSLSRACLIGSSECQSTRRKTQES